MRDYSSYHNANQTDKMVSDGSVLFETSLNAFEGYDISVNNVTKRAVIRSKFTSDGNEKFNIFAKIGDIKFGDLVVFNSKNYIIISDLDETSMVYAKAVMQLCNSTFSVPMGETKTIKGYDSMNRPVYDIVPNPPIELPCIISKPTFTIDNQQVVNLVDGNLHIQLPYSTDFINNVPVGYQFTIHNVNYRVEGIDLTNTVNDSGVIQVLADKV